MYFDLIRRINCIKFVHSVQKHLRDFIEDPNAMRIILKVPVFISMPLAFFFDKKIEIFPCFSEIVCSPQSLNFVAK